MSPRPQAPTDSLIADGAPAARNNGLARAHTDGHAQTAQHRRVSEVQRARMLRAMTDVAAERGMANVSVAHIVARSGVSRRTFYEIFEDRDDCFLEAFEEAVGCAGEYVLDAYDAAGGWRERMRAGLTGLLEFLEAEPGMARVLIVESLGAGRDVFERRRALVDRLVAAVDEGREAGRRDADPPVLTAEGVVGAVLSVIHGRLLAHQPSGARGSRAGECKPGPLLALAGPLMSMIVLPYLGSAAARREAERPLPARTANSRAARRNPLQRLEMRLTYRTMRVLSAIAVHPGSSNRHVAEAAGVTDQGQMSKLLGRLLALGLIENVRAAPTRGEPNSWRLTDKGQEIERAVAE
jgi:AcrR family transcriptional regulator/DNA-binding MarR family transcriptional regulator